MYKKDNHLQRTLNHLGLVSFPDKEDKDQIWIYAICEVQKANGRKEYVVVRHDIDTDGVDSMTVVKDFGSVSAIVNMGDIFPFEYVTETPRSPLKTTADIVSYLAKVNKTEIDFYKGMAKPKVMSLLKKNLIENHLRINKFSNNGH